LLAPTQWQSNRNRNRDDHKNNEQRDFRTHEAAARVFMCVTFQWFKHTARLL
jgi:hypothetical protein